MRESVLGHTPWNTPEIESAFARNFLGVMDDLKRLKGYSYQNELDSISLSLEIFNSSTTDLLTIISSFKENILELVAPTKQNRSLYKEIDLSLRKTIMVTAVSAMSLVDRTRRCKKTLELEGYEGKVQEEFSENETHQFVQGLRNYVCHYDLAPVEGRGEISWESGKRNECAHIVLHKEKLLEFNDWKPNSKKFIQEQKNGIEIGDLFNKYQTTVNLFHDWFKCSYENARTEELNEYRNYQSIVNGLRKKASLNLLLKNLSDMSAYDKLQSFKPELLRYEYEELEKYPLGSKQQVNRLIEMLNENNACDKAIRIKFYDVFDIGKI